LRRESVAGQGRLWPAGDGTAGLTPGEALSPLQQLRIPSRLNFNSRQFKRDHEQRSQQARFDREEPNMMKKAQPLGLEHCYQTEYELRGKTRQSSPIAGSSAITVAGSCVFSLATAAADMARRIDPPRRSNPPPAETSDFQKFP
jgi:hypothetical protein